MDEQIIVNYDELIGYIHNKLNFDKTIIESVLDVEAEFLKEKGIIE
jgi:hypothetical protein